MDCGDVGEGGVLEEASDGVGCVLGSFECTGGELDDVGGPADGGTANLVALDILPHPFVGVELG